MNNMNLDLDKHEYSPPFDEGEVDHSKIDELQNYWRVKKVLNEICAVESPVSEQIAKEMKIDHLVSLDFVSSDGRILPVALAAYTENLNFLEMKFLSENLHAPFMKEEHKEFLRRVKENEPHILEWTSEGWNQGVFIHIIPVVGDEVSQERAEKILSVIPDDKEIIPYQPCQIEE